MATTASSQGQSQGRRSTTFRGIARASGNLRSSIKETRQSILSTTTTTDFDSSFSSSFNGESDSSLTRRLLSRFRFLSRFERQTLVINLIKQCDPSDMNYLSKKIPLLHRDFIRLLPDAPVHRILSYIHPKDFCSVVGVSKTWQRSATNLDLWKKLYANLGLVAMANTYYLPNAPMLVNAKRLYSLGSWSKGNFVFKKFRAHPLGILCIAFDGKHIVTGSADRTCRVFDVKTGDCVKTFTGHDQKIFSIAMDESRIVTGSSDKTIRIYSTSSHHSTSPHLGTLTGHTGTITCLKFIGDVLISGSEDKSVRVWDISKSALAKCGNVSGVGGVEDVVRTAAASFKESMSRGKQQQFRNTERESVTSAGLRDRSPPRRESRFPPPSREGTFVSPGRRDRDSKFSRDGSKTGSISTGRDSICGTTATAQKMTDLSTQFEESRESVIITTKTVVTSEPNDTHKLSHSSSDGASRSPCLLRVLHGHAGGVRSLDFQGSLLFTGDIHGCVRAWHVESGNCVAVINLDNGLLHVTTPDLLSISMTPTSKPFTGVADPITCIQFSNERLVIGLLSGKLSIYHLTPPDSDPTDIPLSFQTLRSWASKKESYKLVSMYSLAPPPPTTQQQSQQKQHGTWALCIHSDSWRLMSGGSEGRCVLWNHQSKKMMYSLKGSLIDSGSGKALTAVVTDEEFGRKRGGIGDGFDAGETGDGLHDRAITGVAFDDQYIVAGGMDGIIRIWEANLQV